MSQDNNEDNKNNGGTGAGDGSGENHDQNHSVKADEELTPEELAAQQENEDFILNFKDEDFEDAQKTAKLEEALKGAKTTVAQKRHYRQKFQELSGKNKPGAAAAASKPGEAKPATDSGKADLSEIVAVRVDYPWLSKESATELVRQAKLNGETVEQTMERPMVKAWLEKEKTKQDVEDASVAPSRRSGGSGAETRDWSSASQEDIEKQRAKIMASGRQ